MLVAFSEAVSWGTRDATMLGAPIVGAPGVSDTFQANARKVFYSPPPNEYLPQGRTIDGSKSRDPGNGVITNLRAGLLLGKITSTGFYAPSVIGVLTNAEVSSSTQHETSAASVTELVRRIGATGTYKITGPPTAAGTVRTLTATYSAASSTNITITALGVNEVQTLTFGAAATGGTMRLRVPLANGQWVTTDAITWNGTDATWLAAINTALDAATGVTGGIVATGAAPDTAITFTSSGTGYAARPQPTDDMISVIVFPTSTTSATTVRTTAGVDGRFVAGSLIQPMDGSETPLTFVPDGSGYSMVAQNPAGSNVYFQNYKLPIGGCVNFSQLLPAVSDASLKTWVKQSLSSLVGGKFSFSDSL